MLETAVEHEGVCRGCWSAQLLPVARCALLHFPGCATGVPTEQVVATALQLLDRAN